jgi:hypothetical protein
MRTKSKYREIKSENVPAEKELPPVAAVAEPVAPAVAVDPKPQAERQVDASLALQQQLEELKRSGNCSVNGKRRSLSNCR